MRLYPQPWAAVELLSAGSGGDAAVAEAKCPFTPAVGVSPAVCPLASGLRPRVGRFALDLQARVSMTGKTASRSAVIGMMACWRTAALVAVAVYDRLNARRSGGSLRERGGY
jgi:hypothetical protein